MTEQGGDKGGVEHRKRFGPSSIALKWSNAGMWGMENSWNEVLRWIIED